MAVAAAANSNGMHACMHIYLHSEAFALPLRIILVNKYMHKMEGNSFTAAIIKSNKTDLSRNTWKCQFNRIDSDELKKLPKTFAFSAAAVVALVAARITITISTKSIDRSSWWMATMMAANEPWPVVRALRKHLLNKMNRDKHSRRKQSEQTDATSAVYNWHRIFMFVILPLGSIWQSAISNWFFPLLCVCLPGISFFLEEFQAKQGKINAYQMEKKKKKQQQDFGNDLIALVNLLEFNIARCNVMRVRVCSINV